MVQVLLLILLNLRVGWFTHQGPGFGHREKEVAVRLLRRGRGLERKEVRAADRGWRPSFVCICIPGAINLHRLAGAIRIEIYPVMSVCRWMIGIVCVLDGRVRTQEADGLLARVLRQVP